MLQNILTSYPDHNTQNDSTLFGACVTKELGGPLGGVAFFPDVKVYHHSM